VITEQDALHAIPSQGFVHDYCKFAVRQTTAPLGYHLACGLALLAAATPQTFHISYAGDLYGNLYTLLVGRSGDDQKSSALGISKKILYEVERMSGQKLLGKQPGSTEGMIDALVAQPRQIIYYSEFGAFLSKAQKKGSYFEPMKALYTDLWDCLSEDTEILTVDGWRGYGQVRKGDQIIVYDPDTENIVITEALDYGERAVREGEKRVCFSGHYMDFEVTEGHRIYHNTLSPNSPWYISTALEYAQIPHERRIPISGNGMEVTTTSGWTENELRFFLLYAAFGEKRDKNSNAVSFVLSSETAATELFDLFRSMGIPADSYLLTGDARITAGTIHKARCSVFFSSLGVEEALSPEFRAWCTDPNAFPAPLNRMSLAEFKVCCGLLNKIRQKHQSRLDFANFLCSKEQADGFSRLAVIFGFHAAISGFGAKRLNLRVTETRYSMFKQKKASDHGFNVKPTTPGQRVWCVTNSYGTLVTRRNGKIVILGNCQPVDRVKANNVDISQPNPRLSLAAGCSLTFLEEHTDPHDWTGGFMGRWAVIYGRRERTVSYPKNDWTEVPALATSLLQRAQMQQAGICLGLSQEAYEKWDRWFHELDRRPIPEIISGAKTRAPTIALKAAMLYAWDFGDPMSGEPWFIQPHHLDWGFRFAELHLKSVIGLSSYMAEHADAHLRRSILEKIPMGGVKSLGQLLKMTKMKKRTVLEVLDGLVVDGTLKLHPLIGAGGEALYERVALQDE